MISTRRIVAAVVSPSVSPLLNELHQVTDLAAPTLGRLGAVE
ncbi:hypothetical protein [Streptomyces ossamyceticus]|uniref:Uncharacterized protein n=1 Tax=Streptomyces ossamyceticus TaxID=249581 RepID=A0ABV2UUI4_9ACTN